MRLSGGGSFFCRWWKIFASGQIWGRELAGFLLRPVGNSPGPEWLRKKGEQVFRPLSAGQNYGKGKVSAEVEEIVRQRGTQNRQGFQEQANLLKVRIEHAERPAGRRDPAFEEAVRKIFGSFWGNGGKNETELARDLRATIQFE